MQDIQDVISCRSSCRGFENRRLSAEDRAKLQEAINHPALPPFGSAVRFVLLDQLKSSAGQNFKLGSYGTITGAKQFIVGVVRAGERALVDFGYQMESVILAATAQGLGTCWLGGAFNRPGFASSVPLAADEMIPAISPVGYPAARRTLADQLLRWSAQSASRLPWDRLFFHTEFVHPLTPDDAGPYQPVLEMVRRAPSASNKQPWRVLKEAGQNRFHFFLQRHMLYSRVSQAWLKTVDLQRVDMGIAMSHFSLTANALGLSGVWGLTEGVTAPPGAEYCATWIGQPADY